MSGGAVGPMSAGDQRSAAVRSPAGVLSKIGRSGKGREPIRDVSITETVPVLG